MIREGDVMPQDKKTKLVKLQLPDSTQTSVHLKLPSANGVRRKDGTGLRIAQGNSDPAALNSLVSEWLVPLLVREFLDQQQTKITVNSNDLTSCPVTREGAASSRIR
jgi:hypothetical protein